MNRSSVACLVALLLLLTACRGETSSGQDSRDTSAASTTHEGPAPASAADSAAESPATAPGCRCTEPFHRPPTQIPIRYAESRELILCAYTANGPRDRLAAYDFGVFECGGSLLYESEGATRYAVRADEPPLAITIIQKSPGEDGLWQWKPVARHTFVVAQDRFQVQTDVVYDPPPMPTRRVDSLKQVVRRLTKNAESVKAYDDINPETLVAELFWCAMERDSECRDMFTEVNEQGWTDAASGEAWSIFHRLLELRRKAGEG